MSERFNPKLVGAEPVTGFRRTGWQRFNPWPTECDSDDGPCSCGAWHKPIEERVRRAPIWEDTQNKHVEVRALIAQLAEEALEEQRLADIEDAKPLGVRIPFTDWYITTSTG